MKLWGGRFTGEVNDFVNEWAASIDFDQVMYKEDIAGSLAHSRMLAKQGIISESDAEQIETGLKEILDDIASGQIEFSPSAEDIHMNIETLLTEKIGDAGKRLHTARSRNDQVATDMRLYMKEQILKTEERIHALQQTLILLSKEHVDTLMPGYTHLQHAQPISLAFHFLSYHRMFARDADRFWDCYKRTDSLPLGAGALSGTTYDTDRYFVADELDFAGIAENALDAVSDRDFAIEYVSAASISMMHLSRFCEELILWNSSEFSFIEMDDAYSTGSSIMPQKKNPDMAELIRGKTGRIYGDLMNILTIMKGLPLAYNKDMQEDKIPLFDAAETLISCLTVFREMLATIKFNKKNMEAAAGKGFMNATDAADYLVKKGLPFRESHEIIGKLVAYSIEKGVGIEDLSIGELKSFSDKFDEDIYEKINLRACMNAKHSEGSTSEKSVLKQIEKADR